MKEIAIAMLVGLAVLILMLWVLVANGVIMQGVFAPKMEEIRNNTFQKSTAYNQGVIQELEAMRFEYVKAEPKHKAALAGIILRKAEVSGEDKLSTDMQAFLCELKGVAR